MENQVLNCIETRRSVRSYDSKPVTKDEIAMIVNSAVTAPSAMNKRPWHISVVEDQQLILDIEKDIIDFFKINGPADIAERNEERGNKIFYGAPLVFFISAEDKAVFMDVGIVAQTVNLAAVSLGLQCVTLGLPRVAFMGEKAEGWRRALDFPEGYDFGIAVAVGHGNEEPKKRELDLSKVSYI